MLQLVNTALIFHAADHRICSTIIITTPSSQAPRLASKVHLGNLEQLQLLLVVGERLGNLAREAGAHASHALLHVDGRRLAHPKHEAASGDSELLVRPLRGPWLHRERIPVIPVAVNTLAAHNLVGVGGILRR